MSRYNSPDPTDLSLDEYRALAAFRYHLRRFLHFSERMARAAGLEPQQHQLLLAIRGLPEGTPPTIGVLAERMQLRHHSTVELVSRAVERGLVRRSRSEADRREVHLAITDLGEEALRELSKVHRQELGTLGPELIRALEALGLGKAVNEES